MPAISLLKGKVVITEGENYIPLRVEGNVPSIEKFIKELSKEYEEIYILDIRGIRSNKPQLDILGRISSKANLWVDAGIRFADSIIDILITGAENVVLGTKTLAGLDEIKKAYQLSQNIVLGIDYKEGIISHESEISQLSPERLASIVKGMGIEKVVFADLGGAEKRIRYNIIKALLSREVKLSVGGLDKENLKELERLGVERAIIDVKELI